MGQCWSLFGRMSLDCGVGLDVDLNVKGLMVQERGNPEDPDYTLETRREQQDSDTMDCL